MSGCESHDGPDDEGADDCEACELHAQLTAAESRAAAAEAKVAQLEGMYSESNVARIAAERDALLLGNRNGDEVIAGLTEKIASLEAGAEVRDRQFADARRAVANERADVVALMRITAAKTRAISGLQFGHIRAEAWEGMAVLIEQGAHVGAAKKESP